MKPGDLVIPLRPGVTIQTIKNSNSNYLKIWSQSSNKIGIIIDSEYQIKKRLNVKILLDGEVAFVYKEEIKVIYELPNENNKVINLISHIFGYKNV